MRRLNDISIEVEDRWQGARPKAKARPAPKPRTTERQKMRRRAPAFWTRRVRKAGLAAMLVVGVGLIPTWLTLSAKGKTVVAGVRAEMLDLSARAGFRVGDIYVEGRSRTPREDLLAALAIKRGDPVFGLDLRATRARVEAISWVRTATLERRLPGEIHLVITERSPIALWQNQGHYYLVDGTGLVVGDETDDPPALPLVVGEGAPDHAAELVGLLASEPSIKDRVKAAQWVSGRRWNLTIDSTEGGITVRLPEEDPGAALRELVKLDREQSLLERKVTLIDMRLPDRLVLRGPPGSDPVAGEKASHGGTRGGFGTGKAKALPGKET